MREARDARARRRLALLAVGVMLAGLLLALSARWHAAKASEPCDPGVSKAHVFASAEIAAVAGFELVPTPLTELNPTREGWRYPALARDLTKPSIGSDLTFLPGERFAGVTDQGPHYDCGDEPDLEAQELDIGHQEHSDDKWLPFAQFAPVVASVDLTSNERLGSHKRKFTFSDMHLARSAALFGDGGRYLSTRTPKLWSDPEQNPLRGMHSDKHCDSNAIADPGGIDAEGLAGPLEDGSFIIGEEYAPSILHVDRNGRVLKRFTPEGRSLPGAYYDVSPVLPSFLVHMQDNRGFESAFILRINGTTQACAILQSPLLSPDDPHQESKLIRTVCVDMTQGRLSGIYLFLLDDNKRMINSASETEGPLVLVLERHHATGTVYGLDYSTGTNVLGHPLADSLALEAPGFPFAEHGIHLVPKTRVLDYPCKWLQHKKIELSEKLEGLAFINRTRLALSNDCDYGKEGEASKIWVFDLASPMIVERAPGEGRTCASAAVAHVKHS